MESDSSHGQTAAASSDHSDGEQQQSDADPDSSEQEESEEDWKQGSRCTPGQRSCRSTGAGGAASTPAAGAQQGGDQALHAPCSHLLWCEAKVARLFVVASSLCTDIAGVSSSCGSGTAAVQVTVEVHTAPWDVRQYILNQQQQQQGQLPAAQGESSTPGPKVFGPYTATLLRDKKLRLIITQLQHQHEPQTYLQHLACKPHCVVLQERVSARVE